ncbi:hypothetical protein V3595_10785 [Bacillus sp. CFBP9009]
MSSLLINWNDNPIYIYYKLSDLAYQIKGNKEKHKKIIQQELNKLSMDIYGGELKFNIIDGVKNNTHLGQMFNKHPFSTNAEDTSKMIKLNITGFQAMAVVQENSDKLFIALAGTNEYFDAKNAAVNLFGFKVPGQTYQSQLYINYLYDKFPEYRDYKWYFVGHSLGGWLAVKTYLDINSTTWLNAPTKFKFGGAIHNIKINGVFTFNPLGINKSGVTAQQWVDNDDNAYDNVIMNYVIENEWLYEIQKMNPQTINYFGSIKKFNKGIKDYKQFGFKPNWPVKDTLTYYMFHKTIRQGHSLSNFEEYVK